LGTNKRWHKAKVAAEAEQPGAEGRKVAAEAEQPAEVALPPAEALQLEVRLEQAAPEAL